MSEEGCRRLTGASMHLCETYVLTETDSQELDLFPALKHLSVKFCMRKGRLFVTCKDDEKASSFCWSASAQTSSDTVLLCKEAANYRYVFAPDMCVLNGATFLRGTNVVFLHGRYMLCRLNGTRLLSVDMHARESDCA